MRQICKVLVPVACLVVGLLGAPAVGAEDGPAVGESAPKFTLPDQNGTPRSLDSFLRGRALAIVFFRSADW